MKHLLFFSLIAFPISVLAKAGLPDKPYIYVEGKAEVEKPADVLTMRFDVAARAPDLAKANVEAHANASKIFDLLKRYKIPDNDVIAETLRSEPEFEAEQSYVFPWPNRSIASRRSLSVREFTSFISSPQ